MRIGIDCRTILNPGLGEAAGVGHYTYFLVKHLLEVDKENDYVLFFDNRLADVTEFEQANSKIWRFPFFQYKKFLPFSYSHMLIAAMILKNHLDVFHAPANILPYSYRRPSVVTVHDLAIYRNPSWFPAQRVSRRLLVPQSLKTARQLIAVSESTKSDLRDIFKVPSSKVTVIHEAAFTSPINLKDRNVNAVKKFRLRLPYLLFIGSIEPRKNLLALVAAFLDLQRRPENHGVQLVLAGGEGFHGKQILAAIKKRTHSPAVKYIGYTTHNEKLDLLRNALGFVFPSLYEGFGLPVLEAMSCGTPVITSNVSSLPEIAGHAALLVDPNKPSSLRSAMSRILKDAALRHLLSHRGRLQARKFTWEKAAKETRDVYLRVGRSRTSSRKKSF